MDIDELFESEHGMLDESKLARLSELTKKQLEQLELSEQVLLKITELLGVRTEDLFLNKMGPFARFCYWDELFFHEFFALQEDVLTAWDGLFVKQFKEARNHFYKLLKEEKWKEAIYFSDKRVSFHVFMKLRNRISPQEQKMVFLDIYVRNEYGFNRLDRKLVREILDMPTPLSYDILLCPEKPDKDGFYRIFRGETEKSTPWTRAYSWTLSRKTAQFFATRFSSKGRVIEAKVHLSDIKAYIMKRGEEEVLVFPENVYMIKELGV